MNSVSKILIISFAPLIPKHVVTCCRRRTLFMFIRAESQSLMEIFQSSSSYDGILCIRIFFSGDRILAVPIVVWFVIVVCHLCWFFGYREVENVLLIVAVQHQNFQQVQVQFLFLPSILWSVLFNFIFFKYRRLITSSINSQYIKKFRLKENLLHLFRVRDFDDACQPDA